MKLVRSTQCAFSVQLWKSNIYFLRILLFLFSLSMISTEAAQVLNPRFESGNLENWSVTSSDGAGTSLLSNGFDTDTITYTNGIINNLGSHIAYANTILGSRDNVTFTAEVYEDDEQSIQLIEADTDIEFTIAVGNNDSDDSSDFGAAAQATLTIGYLSTEQDISTFTLIQSTSFDDATINAGGDNSFSDFSLSTSISSASPAIGKQLAVRVSFDSPSTGQANRQSILDNVRVSVVDPSESIHYKVYLLGGQSNAVGRGDDSDLTSPLSDPQTDVAFYFRSTATVNNLGHLLEETIIPLNTGSGHGTGAPVSEREFGSEISFGRQMADDHPDENIMIIKYAEGGTSLYADWASDGTQYIIFLETVENALAELTAAGHTYELGGMLWTQGEADRTLAYSLVYEENLISLISRVRTDLFDGVDCPFIISGLSENQTADVHISGTGAYNVRQAQEAVANDLAQVAFVDTDDFEVRPTNVIHFDTQGLLDMGYAFAAAIQAEEASELDPVPVANPDTASTTATETTATPVVISPLDNDIDDGLPASLSIASFTMPQKGSVTQDGNFLTYTPPVGFYGEESFSYTITDGENLVESTITVFILAQPQVILSTDFTGSTANPDTTDASYAGTVSDITWTTNGVTDPGAVAVNIINQDSGNTLFTTVQGDDRIAVNNNVGNGGSWAASINTTLDGSGDVTLT
ncbi:sialate O-acetylesterase, partial [Pontiellaceae bacterium B1224]|nr:sialate O-acetylesterase [Pontiellaceae bacterium B1224]